MMLAYLCSYDQAKWKSKYDILGDFAIIVHEFHMTIRAS